MHCCTEITFFDRLHKNKANTKLFEKILKVGLEDSKIDGK